MRSAVATAVPSLPACTESLVPTAEPPARPRTQTWYVPAVTNRTRKSSRGLPVTKPVSTAVPLSGVERIACPPDAFASFSDAQLCPPCATFPVKCSASMTTWPPLS